MNIQKLNFEGVDYVKLFKKDIGIGTLSLFLFIIGFVLVFQYAYFTIGEDVLAFFNFKHYSSLELLNPNSVYISLIFTIPSIALGYKFKNHFGAKAGRALSLSLVLGIFAWFVGFNIGSTIDATDLLYRLF